MRADPADDTNALLLQLVTGGNSTILSADDLPSATFAPSPGIVLVSVLFSLSLTLAILVSFLAILGQQWLVNYRKRSGGGVESQRWEQLQRYYGANRWKLEGVLDNALPALLQVALAIFCLALVMYTRTLSTTMCFVIGTPLAIALMILFMVSMQGARLDPWWPFTTTLSRFIQFIFKNPRRYWPLILVFWLVWLAIALSLFILSLVVWYITTLLSRTAEIWGTSGGILYLPKGDQFDREFARTPAALNIRTPTMPIPLIPQDVSALLSNSTAVLQAVAVKRVLCTSSDFNILIYTAINIQAMKAKEGVQYLLDDGTVHEHLEKLVMSSDEALASAFCCAFSHLLLGGQSAELFVGRFYRRGYALIEDIPLTPQYCKLHPLKKRVGFICKRLKKYIKSAEPESDNFVEYLFYFELLELILDEESDDTQISQWLDTVVQKQRPAEISTPLVVCLAAGTVRILNEGVPLLNASSGLQISQPGPDPEQEAQATLEQNERKRHVKVQQRRVVMAKRLIGAIGWDMQLLPSDPPDR